MLINYINIELLESKYSNRKKLYGDLLTLHTGLLATTSDDITDNNEEVFGLDDIGDMFGNPDVERERIRDRVEGEYNDDFQFDFLDANIINNEPTRIEGIDTTIRDRETRHIREWVSRTIAPQPVDYTINTTLRDNSNPDPDDVWDME